MFPGIVLVALLLAGAIALSQLISRSDNVWLKKLLGWAIALTVLFGPAVVAKIFEHTGIGMAVTILVCTYYVIALVLLGQLAEQGKKRDRAAAAK